MCYATCGITNIHTVLTSNIKNNFFIFLPITAITTFTSTRVHVLCIFYMYHRYLAVAALLLKSTLKSSTCSQNQAFGTVAVLPAAALSLSPPLPSLFSSAKYEITSFNINVLIP